VITAARRCDPLRAGSLSSQPVDADEGQAHLQFQLEAVVLKTPPVAALIKLL